MFRETLGNSYLYGANGPFLDELQRLDDGARDVSHAQIQKEFAELAKRSRAPGFPTASAERHQISEKQYGVLQLIGAYRFQGARHADVDPPKRQEKPYIAELDPAFYGLSDADMETMFGTGSLVGPRE